MNSVQNPAYQAGMEARFAIASRHSRMVRLLRIAVPAAVILALGAIVGLIVLMYAYVFPHAVPHGLSLGH